MSSPTAPAAPQGRLTLKSGEVLMTQGQPGSDLYVLESGRLSVERDGVNVATIDTRNALIGEMSVVLGTPHSATVRAAETTVVQVIPDARRYLEQDQALTFRIARLMATRLDATSAHLAEMARQQDGRTEGTLLGKILSALHMPSDDDSYVVARKDMFDWTR